MKTAFVIVAIILFVLSFISTARDWKVPAVDEGGLVALGLSFWAASTIV